MQDSAIRNVIRCIWRCRGSWSIIQLDVYIRFDLSSKSKDKAMHSTTLSYRKLLPSYVAAITVVYKNKISCSENQNPGVLSETNLLNVQL